MKPATIFASGIALAMLAPVPCNAQQAPSRVSGAMVQAPAAAQPQQTRATRQRAPGGRTEQTFQMLDFTFWTGGDDLRSDSALTANLVFPDHSHQPCFLHGSQAPGGAANISWDNNSMHDAPPCHLLKARTLRDLKETSITLQLWGPGSIPNFMEAISAGPLALAGFRSQDNWNMNRVVIRANNPDSGESVCVRSVSENPVARLTGDQPEVTVSNFPNQCR